MISGHTNGHTNGKATNGKGNGQFYEDPFESSPNSWTFPDEIPTLSWWLNRDLPGRDNLLGEFISTTSRIMLVAPTGIGKTTFCMALAGSLSTGLDFLHWKAVRPARVLYIDGEMPSRLIKRRLADMVRRRDSQSDNLVVLSREDYPDMPPLNTEKGQQFIDEFIAWAGGFDFIIFDNLQALLSGEMKEPEQWSKMLNWNRNLTRRKSGHIWVHHANDDGRGYGDKTREWGLESVLALEAVENPGADISFSLKFTKARERTPDNRGDFEDAMIRLADDQWTSSRGAAQGQKSSHRGKPEDIALQALDEALAKTGTTPPNHPKIPPETYCVQIDLWQRYFEQVHVGDATPESIARTFRKFASKLQADGKIGAAKPWVWRIHG